MLKICCFIGSYLALISVSFMWVRLELEVFSISHPVSVLVRIVTLPIFRTIDEGDLVLAPFMSSGTTG